jgi:hypothetical protein
VRGRDQGRGRQGLLRRLRHQESAEAPKRTLTEWRDRLNRDLVFTFAPWNCTMPVIAMIDGCCLAGALDTPRTIPE